MSEWYYSKDGAQLGPVSESEIKAMLANGTLDAPSSLVWKSGMADWMPAAQVPELSGAPAAAVGDPYAAPVSGFGPAAALQTTGPLPEIEPGSESIDAMACFKRGFDLAVRHIGLVLLTALVWFGVSFVVSVISSGIQAGLRVTMSDNGQADEALIPIIIVLSVVEQVFSIFLMLGMVRFSLNIASGRDASVANLFGEGRLLFRGVVATLLFTLMTLVGLVLFIVPGFYVIARYGLYMSTIVDRDRGILEAFEESSRLTTNNRMNMFLVTLISFAVIVLGCLALGIGLLFAYPVMEFAWVVAYLWLRYGYRAAMDHPGTATPMLTPAR